MGSVLDAKHFRDEAAAYKWVEARVWPNGRVCPHCGSVDDSGPLKGKSTRLGVYKCYAKECRKPFTVKVGTIFESSHIKLHIWLQAMFLLASSKKGISSNQLARTLGVTLKSAWFLSHRIREAMKDTKGGMFGSGFGGVEADETLQGVDPRKEPREDGTLSVQNYNRVLTLIDRDTGAARSFVMTEFTTDEVQRILNENVAKEAYLLTDEAPQYKAPGQHQTFHGSTTHSKGEYVSKDAPWVHTNTVEGYYSVFKRGMKGVYQHCGRDHLHRYTAEFDFRYSNRAKLGVDDVARFTKIVEGVTGKRLTYRTTGRQSEATA
ncbi:IS1595 family transposase [Vitreimonas flagellata]|uniref:IS1595 family transposase n=1 Tax=Vitreimonas flagellata TaxID=2560861 RepID=UPI001075192D|nr:IS1595 family transposase [Vitreimonas flagellata]